jgi:hypothetical protein
MLEAKWPKILQRDEEAFVGPGKSSVFFSADPFRE